MGRRTSRAESGAGVSAGTDNYSYDAVDQVTAVGYGSGRNVSYTYDANGNRTNVTDSGTASTYVANSLNQYITANGAIHSYDANGNLQGTSVWNYTYDAQNRLISASNGTTTATLAYDAANRCVSRNINGTTTYLYYNGWQLIEERDGSDNLLASYVHGAGLDELLTRTTGAGTFYYHEDGLGNVVKLTDSTGTVQEGYSYDVFGAVTIRDGSGTVLTASASGNRFLYTGREYIAELGLYDYRNRVYSPNLGRFLQTDPIRFEAGDVNIYRYVGNGAPNATDASGLDAMGSLLGANPSGFVDDLTRTILGDPSNRNCPDGTTNNPLAPDPLPQTDLPQIPPSPPITDPPPQTSAPVHINEGGGRGFNIGESFGNNLGAGLIGATLTALTGAALSELGVGLGIGIGAGMLWDAGKADFQDSLVHPGDPPFPGPSGGSEVIHAAYSNYF
jgi:RHS repeat-associated protein